MPSKAETVASMMGFLFQQEYRLVESRWWLFSRGKPSRVLEQHEIDWHIARKHEPFVPGGVKPDDPRWWDEPAAPPAGEGV